MKKGLCLHKVVLFLLISSLLSGCGADIPKQITDSYCKVVEARAKSIRLVKTAKSSIKDPVVLAKAQNLYGVAEDKGNALLALLKVALVSQGSNYNFEQNTKDLNAATEEFANYVTSNTMVIKTATIPADIGQLAVDIIIKVWKEYKADKEKRIEEIRKEMSTYEWPAWGKIE